MNSEQHQLNSRTILERLADYERADRKIATEAEIVEEHSELATVSHHTRLFLTEDSESEEMPQSRYEQKRERYKPYTERYDYPPDGYSSLSIEFITNDEVSSTCDYCQGEQTVSCSRCTGGTKQCPECTGAAVVTCADCEGEGTQPCENCRGSGSVSKEERTQCVRCEGSGTFSCPDCHGADSDCSTCYGEGVKDCDECGSEGIVTEAVSVQCPACNGSMTEPCDICAGTKTVDCEECSATGTVRCSSCSGTGEVTCRKCKGDGQTVTATVGEISYRTETELQCSSERIPLELFEEQDTAGGDTETVEPAERPDGDDKALYRETTKSRQVDCQYIVYRFHGEKYGVLSVEGDLRYIDYPRSSDYIADQIEAATAEGYFEYGNDESVATKIGAGVRTLAATAIWTAVGAAAISLLITVLGAASVAVLPADTPLVELITLGTAAIGGVKFAEQRYSKIPKAKSAIGGGVIGAVVLALSAAVILTAGIWSPADQLILAAIAAAAVSTQTSDQLRFEAKRVSHALAQREEFLVNRLDGRYDEVHRHELSDRLPDPDNSPLEATFAQASRRVYVFGFGLSVFYIGLLAISNVANSGSLLLEYIDLWLALAGPVLIITGSLVVWLVLFTRRI